MFRLLYKLIKGYCKECDAVGYARRLGVTVGENCRLIDVDFSSEPYLITLGNHVSATATRFETHDGGVWVFREENPMIDIVRPIKVGNNVFFGYGCIVMPGVTIGDNVVIGAGALVTRDIPSGCVAAGVPARILKDLTEYKAKVYAEHDATKLLSWKAKKKYYLEKYRF